MDGWILFAIAMVCVAAVLATLGFVAITGWRLAKRAGRFAGEVTRALEPTMRGAEQAAAKAADLAGAAQTLTEHVARLQVAFARLGVLGDAVAGGLAPLRDLRSYFGK